MPTTTKPVDAVLKEMARNIGPLTRQQIGCTRYRLLTLMQDKLVKQGGEVKYGSARKAVTYELTARGRKRAEKAS